jgi:hypothetical protein
MMHSQLWACGALFFLGAWHGINPAMGWLFAVALGLQKQSGRAVWQSLVPIALGHILAIGGVVAIALFAGASIRLQYAKYFVAALLFLFGLFRLFWGKHPRYGGMQVGFRDLTVWSFLTATAHGAGFMLLPILLGLGMSGEHGVHEMHGPHVSGPWVGVLAVAVHTLGYLFVTGIIAWIVYTKLGLAVLRRAWFNLDRIWAVSLIATAVLTLLLPTG